MARSSWLLVLGARRCRIVRHDGAATETCAEVELSEGIGEGAERVAAAIASLSGRPPVWNLALESELCLGARVTLPTRRQARQASAVAFRAEGQLPWSAEEFVHDAELDGTNAFVVVSELEPLAKFVEGLEAQGYSIGAIWPLARLALARHLQSHPKESRRCFLVWVEEGYADCWLLDRGRSQQWERWPSDPAALSRAWRRLQLSEPVATPLVLRGASAEFVTSLQELCETPITAIDPSAPLELAFEEIWLIEAGSRDADLDLRSGPLAGARGGRHLSRHVAALALAACGLLAAIGFALFWQNQQSHRLLQEMDDRQARLHQQVFPNERVPVGILSRLDSEAKRLRALHGGGSGPPAAISSLDVLARILRALPQDYRFQLMEIRIENGQFYLLGQVRSHGDADRFVTAMRAAGLEAGPPNTHQLPTQGVEFRAIGKLPAELPSGSPTLRVTSR